MSSWRNNQNIREYWLPLSWGSSWSHKKNHINYFFFIRRMMGVSLTVYNDGWWVEIMGILLVTYACKCAGKHFFITVNWGGSGQAGCAGTPGKSWERHGDHHLWWYMIGYIPAQTRCVTACRIFTTINWPRSWCPDSTYLSRCTLGDCRLNALLWGFLF